VGRVEEGEDAVEAFGGELVVGEGAEEFGDEDVDWDVCLRRFRGVGLGLGCWKRLGVVEGVVLGIFGGLEWP